MSAKKFPVRIRCGNSVKDYSPEFQTNVQFEKGWQSVLKAAYQNAEMSCLCYGKGAKKLAIRRYDGTDSFSIARFPGTGSQHCPECLFYALDVEASGLIAYQPGVIEELASGMFRVKLAFGLETQNISASEVHSIAQNTHRKSKPSISLQALMHLLWSESRLNTWYPAMEGKRSLSLVNHVIRQAAGRIQVKNRPLNDYLLVASPKERGRMTMENEGISTASLAADSRLIVIAPLAKHTPERESGNAGLVPIQGFYGIPRLGLPAPVWCKCLGKFPRQIASWRDGQRTMAIMHVEWNRGNGKGHNNPRLKVLDLAIMTVSEQWIPSDSSYESIVETQLRLNNRSFLKPLTYDAEVDLVLPDFWLLDTGKSEPVPMEVFGMTAGSYLKRKEEKFRFYNHKYGINGWWYWDATHHKRNDPLPEFPKIKAR